MTYHLLISPTLAVPAAEFADHWNNTPGSRKQARAEVADAGVASYDLDPALIQQGLLVLSGFAGAVAYDVLKDVIKAQLETFITDKLNQLNPPKLAVDKIEQPDGSVLLVVKEEEG